MGAPLVFVCMGINRRPLKQANDYRERRPVVVIVLLCVAGPSGPTLAFVETTINGLIVVSITISIATQSCPNFRRSCAERSFGMGRA